MRRDERLAQAEARAKAQLDAHRARLAHVHVAQREEARKALARRHLLVGKLAQEAGLFAWTDASLGRVFQLLTPLAELAHPEMIVARVLARVPVSTFVQEAAEVNAEVDALITDKVALVLVDDAGNALGRHGFAHQDDGVSPCRAD